VQRLAALHWGIFAEIAPSLLPLRFAGFCTGLQNFEKYCAEEDPSTVYRSDAGFLGKEAI